MSRLAPQGLLLVASAVAVVLIALAWSIAIHQPWLGAAFQVDRDVVVIRSIGRDSVLEGALVAGTTVVALESSRYEVALMPDALVPDPDVFATYAGYRQFFET